MSDAYSSALRAVYYEDQDKHYATYVPHLSRLLRYKSDSIEMQRAGSRTELQALLTSRPHVAFIDNQHDAGPVEGLQATAKLKRDHPDTLFCLVTTNPISAQSLGSYTPNPDVIIYKGQLGEKTYDNYLGRKLRSLIKRSPFPLFDVGFDLHRDGPKLPDGGKPLTQAELHSILEQVVDTDGMSARATEFETARLDVIRGGFSGSGVYNLQITRAGGRPNVPAILKISERAKANKEIENFRKYVKWRLPYLWRVDLLGTASTARFGAICYSPAMGGFSTPLPVNTFIREGKLDVIDRVLQSVLHSDNQTWYSEQSQTEHDARDYFKDERFYSSAPRREVLENNFYAYLRDNLTDTEADFIDASDHIRIFGTRYPKIDRLIFNNEWGLVTECLCHGDMNGNNLLYAAGEAAVVFIDFQDTGYWHVFRDFVSFECSVRLEHPRGEAEEDLFVLFKRCLGRERTLAADDWTGKNVHAGDYTEQVARVRGAAHSNFPDEPKALYLIANVVHCLWIFEKSTKWAPHKRIRLAASILESVFELSNIHKARA